MYGKNVYNNFENYVKIYKINDLYSIKLFKKNSDIKKYFEKNNLLLVYSNILFNTDQKSAILYDSFIINKSKLKNKNNIEKIISTHITETIDEILFASNELNKMYR